MTTPSPVPLSDDELNTVLAALACAEPEGFVTKAVRQIRIHVDGLLATIAQRDAKVAEANENFEKMQADCGDAICSMKHWRKVADTAEAELAEARADVNTLNEMLRKRHGMGQGEIDYEAVLQAENGRLRASAIPAGCVAVCADCQVDLNWVGDFGCKHELGDKCPVKAFHPSSPQVRG